MSNDSQSNIDFETEMQNGFIEEGLSLIARCEQCFLRLEQAPDDAENLKEIFRLAHNLKGASRAVGFGDFSHFSHELENLLIRLKDKKLQVTDSIVSLLLRCNDFLRDSLEKLRSNPTASIGGSELIQEIESHLSGNNQTADPLSASHEPGGHAEGSARSSSDPDPVDEALFNPLSLNRPLKPTPTPDPIPAPPENSPLPSPPSLAIGEESIRVSLGRLEKLVNLVGEMVILQTVLREQSSIHSSALLRNTVHQLGKVTQSVQDLSMSLRMVPVRQTFQRMQRIVRDVSK